MCKEVFCILKEMDADDVNTQLAVQCAPVITGIKISNLLIVPKGNEQQLVESISGTGLMYFRMFRTEKGVTYLLFRRRELEQYISEPEVQDFFRRIGYRNFSIGKMLVLFQKRYHQYMVDHKNFPHEMGLLLGYPIEDVAGFVENAGKNYLYAGYWKVYTEVSQKLELFHSYDCALREIAYLVSEGIQVRDICQVYKTACEAVG